MLIEGLRQPNHIDNYPIEDGPDGDSNTDDILTSEHFQLSWDIGVIGEIYNHYPSEKDIYDFLNSISIDFHWEEDYRHPNSVSFSDIDDSDFMKLEDVNGDNFDDLIFVHKIDDGSSILKINFGDGIMSPIDMLVNNAELLIIEHPDGVQEANWLYNRENGGVYGVSILSPRY